MKDRHSTSAVSGCGQKERCLCASLIWF